MTKQKDLDFSIYYDYYGSFLTEKQSNLFELYYNDDLSLSEISSLLGITRQGVRDGLERARKKLLSMEAKLGLVKNACEFKNSITE